MSVPEYLRALKSCIERDVASGFVDRDEFAANAVEYMEGTDGGPSDPMAIAE